MSENVDASLACGQRDIKTILNSTAISPGSWSRPQLQRGLPRQLPRVAEPLRAAWLARKNSWEGDDFDVGLLADRLPPAALEAAVAGQRDRRKSYLYWRLHHELAYPLTPAVLGCLNENNAKRLPGFVPLKAHPARAIDFPGRVVPGQKARPQPSRAPPRGLLGAPAGQLTPRPLAALPPARARSSRSARSPGSTPASGSI